VDPLLEESNRPGAAPSEHVVEIAESSWPTCGSAMGAYTRRPELAKRIGGVPQGRS